FTGPLQPRAFDTTRWNHHGTSPWDAKILLHNAKCKIAFWQCREKMQDLVRNSDGDQLLFDQNGSGDLYCDFGHLAYRDGDYIVLPRGTMWRLEPQETTDLLMVEAVTGSYMLPDKGMLGPHAIFDPAILDTPVMDEAFRAQQGPTPTRVVIKRRDQLSTVEYPFNPLDAVGWKGE